MAYTLPSVHIYQLLENSGGAARVTPDLEAVVIGALINVVDVETNPLKAKSLEFSAWPGASVDPKPPVDEGDPVDPEPPVEEGLFTINPSSYHYTNTTDDGLIITGVTSSDIGESISLRLAAVSAGGVETFDANPLDVIGTLARNANTGMWTFTVAPGALTLSRFFLDNESAASFKVYGKGLTEGGALYQASAVVTVTKEVVVEPTSLTLDSPVIYYSYSGMIKEELAS